MNDITIRFLDVYNHLKSVGKVNTPKGFATEIGVSTSLITEICKKRTNAGLTPIQNLITRFEHISPEWLITGKGSMIKEEKKEENPPDNYKELAESRKETIELLRGNIASLEKEVLELREKINIEASINASVQRGTVDASNRP
jgi:hypothetical protein